MHDVGMSRIIMVGYIIPSKVYKSHIIIWIHTEIKKCLLVSPEYNIGEGE